jgi:hypothetical protein
MYAPFILKFYYPRMAVRVKMCGIDTVNGTLGMEWGVGNELTGSDFNLGHINLRFLVVIAPNTRSRPLATIHNREKNEWNHTSTHFHTGV